MFRSLFYLLFQFSFAFLFVVSIYAESEIINLLYSNANVEVVSSPSKQKLDESFTYNTYFQDVFLEDNHFLNLHTRMNRIDHSLRVLNLPPGEKIHFKIKQKLDHLLNYSFKENIYSFENNPMQAFLNGKRIDNSQVFSKREDNLLTLYNSGEHSVLIHNPYLISASHKKRTDVIFIVIDSLRGDVLGCNGGEFGVTPNLDAFSKTSYTFQKHYVNSSWTRPSTMIFFTGVYASKTFINFWDYPVFSEERTMFYQSDISPLPALLSSFGYNSIMVGNNPFLTDHRYLGVDTGFESVYDFAPVNEDTPKITQQAIDVVQKNKKKFYNPLGYFQRPLFLFLNYNDPHRPYTPPYNFLNQVKVSFPIDTNKLNYLGEVAYVDSELGKFFQFLKDNDMYDSSLIIVTSDHGEVMNPAHAKSKFTDVYTMYGHGQGLYDEDIHTPLLIKYPYQKEGKQIQATTRSIDIMPTILDVLDVKGSTHTMDGKTLGDVIWNKETTERLYYGEGRGVKGVRKSGYKFMQKTFEFHKQGVSWDGIVGDEPNYLYNLMDDPNEESPIENQTIVTTFQDIVKNFKALSSVYSIRVFNPNHSQEKSLYLTALSKKGRVVTTDTEGFFKNLEEATYYQDGFVLEKKISGGQTYELNLVVYPDVTFPEIQILIDGQRIGRSNFGVGQFDVYPGDCLHINKNCSLMYMAKYRKPPIPKKFRVQIWKTGLQKNYNSKNVLLEKDAIDILKKQGYIQ
ncbi:MAG: sulfatase [Leptospiraceae bacterium]|nr:sulfatase [Leptospiraceae bacterium]